VANETGLDCHTLHPLHEAATLTCHAALQHLHEEGHGYAHATPPALHPHHFDRTNPCPARHHHHHAQAESDYGCARAEKSNVSPHPAWHPSPSPLPCHRHGRPAAQSSP